MSREVRKVPADWQHPRNANFDYIPLCEGSADISIAEWDDGAAKWAEGLREDWATGGWKPLDGDERAMTYEEWAGARPSPSEYMGEFPEGAATHYMMYETTSEGTPISPAMKTPEALARWLANTGASSFGGMTATYEQWLRVCQGEFAPSVVIIGDRMMSGVEATERNTDD
jgi:hypothetical protein